MVAGKEGSEECELWRETIAAYQMRVTSLSFSFLGEDSVQLLRDDPEGLGCDQGGPEPTVNAHRQDGSESSHGRHWQCAYQHSTTGMHRG